MNIQLFAQLCESIIDEASSAMSLIGTHPGASAIIKKLHAEQKLSHNQEFQIIQKISWSDLKNRWPSGWVLVTGPKGTGAIRSHHNNYHALASTGGEAVGFSDAKGGNILNFLQGYLGGKWEKYSYWIGTENKYAQDKQRSRQAAAPQDNTVMTPDMLMAKFRPLWGRAVELAIGDIKGMVTTMIKNDAWEKAERKINHLKRLEEIRDILLRGDTERTPESIKTAMSSAIAMSAVHFYPDQSGEVERPRYGSGGYTTQNHEGTRMLLKDLANGDQKKLGTVLAFFKRSLISG